MTDAAAYGVTVRMVRESGELMYQARVAELPDVRVYASTYDEAYHQALEVIEATQEAFAEEGRPMPPVELPDDEFSGRVTLRMSKSMHAEVHRRATADGVSLNAWIVEAVCYKASGVAKYSPTVVIQPHINWKTGVSGFTAHTGLPLLTANGGSVIAITDVKHISTESQGLSWSGNHG